MPTPRQQIESQIDWAIANGKIPAADRQKHIEFLVSNQDFYSSALAGGAHFTNKAKEMALERQQAEAQIQAERAKLAQERNEMAAWGRDARAELDRVKAIENEHRALLEENARMRQLAKDYNIEDELPARPEPQRQMPNQYQQPMLAQPGRQRDPETGRFLSRQEGEQFAQGVLNMTSGAMAAAAEHFALFGTPLSDNIMQEAIAAGAPDVKAYWETKYNVPAKRQEKAETDRAAEIERIRAEERQKVMTEMAIDPSRFVPGQGTYQSQRSPLQDAYMHSRAAAMNPVTESGERIVPEKMSDIQATNSRVQSSAAAFAKHYNPDGSPRQGVKPHATYAPVSYEGT